MFQNIVNKIILLPKLLKIFCLLLVDLSIIIFSSYISLAIRLDEFFLHRLSDKYLISIEFFLIPVVVYLIFAAFFRFYSLSFRYYNLGSDIYYVYPVFGIVILFLNILFNDYFSYGAVIINIIFIIIFIIVSRKIISKIYYIAQTSSKINSIIICSSKNLHLIYEFLKLNPKISIKAIILSDSKKIDFTKYLNFKIYNLSDLDKICKIYNIKKIYTDKNNLIYNTKSFKKISINFLKTDDLFLINTKDTKQEFVDKFFKFSEKIKKKSLKYYDNKTILITGAGGSIGKNLFFEFANSNPKKIILVEQDELKLFNLKKELENFKIKNLTKFNVEFILGNLSNDFFLKNIFVKNSKIDFVLHAAAYKHVGFGEENLMSFVKNNIFVTYNLAEISIKNNVKKFIFISTDKAVNPKSIMGYTKSFCEKILLYLNEKHQLNNFFKIVRFGNVINSDGSVLPIFEKQILDGGPVTVTDKNVTRYFMSISNACKLVLHTIEINKKIGIYILDMGKSYKILDIAKSMINFYFQKKKITSKPKIVFIGLQKGEKIYEELILGKNLQKSEIKNILIANEKINILKNYSDIISKLENAYKKNDEKKILDCLKYNV